MTTGIKDIKNESFAIVYPNPGSDIFTLEATFQSTTNKAILEIVNELGVQIYFDELKVENKSIKYDFNLSSYADGIYLVRLITEHGTKSIIIQKQ